MRHSTSVRTVTGILLALLAFSPLAGTVAGAAESQVKTVPYPAALASASVTLQDISEIGTRGLVVGNGELNAIVYSSGNELRLRLAKNDCWDLRVDTQSDPPMPQVDPAAGTSSGHGAVGSWKAPYPTALPCAEVILSSKEKSMVTSGTLDLAKAQATVRTTSDTTEVRVLAQGNVILIRSDRELSFASIREFLKTKDLDKWVNPAERGTRDGYVYLHQSVPGDEDVKPFDVYVVAGKKQDLWAVAVTTSRDCEKPLDEACRLVARTLPDADAVAKHEANWRGFWSASGVELGDAELQRWWYRMVYFFRVFSKADGNAAGLAACFSNLAGWHNSLKLNYNIQQSYLAAAPVNHPEMLEPFIDVLTRALPRGKWFAAASFKGAEGAFFFSDFYPFEPDPAKCVTPHKHQQTYMPWGYTWGMAGHSAVVVWDYYLYLPTPKRLERVYPLIREIGTFYCSILEKCPLENGKRKMGPSFFPELGRFNQFNVCYDIAFITAALRIAREAATLKKDEQFLARINAVIEQVPDFGTKPDPDQGNQPIIDHWAGAKLNEGADRHGTLVMGVFPAGVINWFSPEPLKETAKRTINYVEKSTSHANSNVTLNIARARMGLGADAIANAKMCFSASSSHSPERPNGLFNWKGHGVYMTEQVAVARLVSELLLQSTGGVIRVFPAWPANTDAKFARLLAEGGFEVSAELVGGRIGNVKIHAMAGGTAKVLSPWPGGFSVAEQDGGAAVPVEVAPGGIVTFATSSGKTYLLNAAR